MRHRPGSRCLHLRHPRARRWARSGRW